MRTTVQARTDSRPYLSPTQPKKKPPNGRATKDTAYTAKVLSNATTGSVFGKKWTAMAGATNA